MNSYVNMGVGALLGTVFVLMSVSIASEGIFHASLPEKEGFAIVAEEAGEAGDEPDPAPTEPEQAATPVPGRPDAPAGAEFRSDPSSVVAATGRPQLLEFFTYW